MAIHSSILARRIPWTEEPGGSQSMGSQRVRHDLVTEQQQQQERCRVILYKLWTSFGILTRQRSLEATLWLKSLHATSTPATVKPLCVHECQATKSCPTLCDSMDCDPPGSSVHGILQARILGWIAMSPPEELPTQGSNPGFPHCRWILYRLSYQ